MDEHLGSSMSQWGPGLTTPCHRIRPSEEPVVISSSIVSGESWALHEINAYKKLLLITVDVVMGENEI